MTITAPADIDLAILERVQRRVLWLAVRIVDHANRGRPKDEIKVGGHQASSASMVSIMTALWFGSLRAEDRVSVKPHASPVLHAVNYLLGRLDRRYLSSLRTLKGLQAYPSRTKDPDPVDYSTGSVGLGAAAPLFGAVAARYVERHFGNSMSGRFISIMGDAELDEGNVWEAITDPAVHDLGNVLWIVDLNRQSLDRIVPGVKAHRLIRMFAENGWQVLEAKYGARLQEAFGLPGGDALRRHLDEMSNEQYQSLFGLSAAEMRARFLSGADGAVERLVGQVLDADLPGLLLNLGGHDLGMVLDCYARAEKVSDRPSVVFAYTVKGWGLPMAGDPLNHSALLTPSQIDAFREELGLRTESEWDLFAPSSPEGQLCAAAAARTKRPAPASVPARPQVPTSSGPSIHRATSTQEAFGRILVNLARHKELARRIVTTSPDVAVSTNLGGWVNKVGVFAPLEAADYGGGGRLLRWQPGPQGRHIELGISEMNLFLLLGQLGLAEEMCGELLLPIGTVYDPFVLRGLDAFIYSVYSGSKFIVVGTPSGVTLSYEGGAHQSIVTPSVGLELPGVTFAEPAYALALDWLLCDGLAGLCDRDGGESLYLRLTTRPIDQTPFEEAKARIGEEELRRQVLRGGYRLVDGAASGEGSGPGVQIVCSGAVVPEALRATRSLAEEGVVANLIDVTSADRLYRDWTAALKGAIRSGRHPEETYHLADLVPPEERSWPIVTVHDSAPHAMAWLGSVFGAPAVGLGVETFGESGSIGDLYHAHALCAGGITNAALVALGRAR